MPARHPSVRLSRQFDADGTLVGAVGPGAGLAFAERHFPLAEEDLCIATAYFHLHGYDLIRDFVSASIRVRVLVGREDRDREQTREAVREEIRLELSGVGPARIVQAAREVLNRLESGRFVIADARSIRRPFHCKFYISNGRLMWHGSANLSRNGMRAQSEQASAVTDSHVIAEWRAWYDEVMAGADDLTAEVADELRAWLTLSDPFEAYLVALHYLLEGRELRRGKDAHVPDYYQQQLATWAVREIGRCGGALLVVSTGLGKTTIGAEIAGLLMADDEVEEVILLAPRVVHPKWRQQLDGRRVPARRFDNGALFLPPADTDSWQVAKLDRALARADGRTLLLIDEAHVYRNQLLRAAEAQKTAEPRRPARALERVVAAVQRGARVALLTGSAYGTSLHDLRCLLRMLPPPVAYGESLRPWADLFGETWAVDSVADVVALPLVSVLSYPTVLDLATRRGDSDGDAPFLMRDGCRMYLPTTFRSEIVSYRLTEEGRVRRALDAGAFAAARPHPAATLADDGTLDSFVSDPFLADALEAWTGSPWALSVALDKNLNTEGIGDQEELFESPSDGGGPGGEEPNTNAATYKKPMRQGRAQRAGLRDVKARVEAAGRSSDDKAMRLVRLLVRHRRKGALKGIVFVERLVTALYVVDCIRREAPTLRVATTVGGTVAEPRLQDARRRLDILHRFAPRANHREPRAEDPEVLVCTDADGIGVDLEDATVLVNYDLPTGADGLTQRLGRILRPTPDRNRALSVHTFVAKLAQTPAASGAAGLLYSRFARLRARNDAAAELTASGMLPLEGRTACDVSLREVPVDAASRLTLLSPSRPDWITTHLAVLEQHRHRAAHLSRRAVHSAFYTDDPTPQVVVLFRSDGQVGGIVATASSGEAISTDWKDVLRVLGCEPGLPRLPFADVGLAMILQAANRAIRSWCHARGTSEESVERLLEVYLAPRPLPKKRA